MMQALHLTAFAERKKQNILKQKTRKWKKKRGRKRLKE
jgi:hypothetical protein